MLMLYEVSINISVIKKIKLIILAYLLFFLLAHRYVIQLIFVRMTFLL